MKAGAKPVYMGWGSMVCKSPEHTVKLAVEAAKCSGQRAILLGGYENFSMETLKKASDDADLIKFAEDNICFVSTAPHEWLFPQCACIIHHGGAGTTNCTIRAGVPQVITPVFLDQFDHAYLVKKLGIGFGFSKQLQTLTSKELGDAIKTTVGSSDMSSKAAEVGKEVAAEMASNGSLIMSPSIGRNISAAENRRLSLKTGWQVKRRREPALASAETEEVSVPSTSTSSSSPCVFQEVFGTKGLPLIMSH